MARLLKTDGDVSFHTPARPSWQDRANCDGIVEWTFIPEGSKEPMSLFFPDHSKESEAASRAERLFCGSCPVRAQCFRHANDNREKGIWAGTTETLRAKMRHRRYRSRCPGCARKDPITVDNVQICPGCSISWPTPAPKEKAC